MEHHTIRSPCGNPSVYVRLDPSIFHALDATAADAGLSRAGWVRRELIRALSATHGDFQLRPSPPSPPRRPAVIPAADLVEVSCMAAALSRTGGAVVQLTKALREARHVAHADAEEVLRGLRTVQRDVAGLVARLGA